MTEATQNSPSKSRAQTIADRFRGLEVGQSAEFSAFEYNPSTIRSTPRSSLLREQSLGMRWRTRTDVDRGVIIVTRVR